MTHKMRAIDIRNVGGPIFGRIELSEVVFFFHSFLLNSELLIQLVEETLSSLFSQGSRGSTHFRCFTGTVLCVCPVGTSEVRATRSAWDPLSKESRSTTRIRIRHRSRRTRRASPDDCSGASELACSASPSIDDPPKRGYAPFDDGSASERAQHVIIGRHVASRRRRRVAALDARCANVNPISPFCQTDVASAFRACKLLLPTKQPVSVSDAARTRDCWVSKSSDEPSG